MRGLELSPDGGTVMVFSHPNHELAIFGLLQRLRPHLVYLTDGGGAGRVNETRRGLQRIGLAERADFLNHSEASLYDALLDRNLALYREVVAQVRERLAARRPRQVFCDAVEFYNPLHDMSLPIVRAALDGTDAELFEVPLVYQTVGQREAYEVQRMPPSRRAGQVEVQLSERELATKLQARDSGYALLQQQMGPVLSSISDEHWCKEIVAPAAPHLPKPVADCVLRYEWRGQTLLDRGEVAQRITYTEHYLPIATSL
jgi:hypothetical protein